MNNIYKLIDCMITNMQELNAILKRRRKVRSKLFEQSNVKAYHAYLQSQATTDPSTS
jgi:hypothetical protein